jgi:hypothetical protein
MYNCVFVVPVYPIFLPTHPVLIFLPCNRTTFSCFPFKSTMKIAAADSTETSVLVYQATQSDTSEDTKLCSLPCV